MNEGKQTHPSTSILDVNIDKIIAFHCECLNSDMWPNNAKVPLLNTNLWSAISENHRNNSLLWAEEDLARRKLAADSEIAANKRNIDRYNQARNDAIEAIDEHLLAWAHSEHPYAKAENINSESAGSIIDRLSILSLKKHAFSRQLERNDVDDFHLEDCRKRLTILSEQQQDLITCLSGILADAARGTIRWKIYKQFKMYNDPNLNPQLYHERKDRS